MTPKPQEITKNDDREVSYIPFGASDKIRLTASMVRQFIAVPTRSGKLPSERDSIRFIMLCRGKRADPFQGDCYLIGYDSQFGPSFSMVCGIDLFLKRAEQSDAYDGRESGVIVETAGGVLQERNGSFLLKGEKLLGGWAKVYRKDRKFPEYKSVSFEIYDTGRSRWEKDPGGMIEKVALSQALRSAYPTALGGLYTQEEMTKLTEAGAGMFTTADREPIVPSKPVDESKPSEPASDQPASSIPTVQDELAQFLTDAGVSFDDCRSFLDTKQLLHDASSIASFNELPEDVCIDLKGNTKLLNELIKKFGTRAKA